MTACPEDERLRLWLLGDLTESDSSKITSHTEACDRCQATLAQLETSLDLGLETLKQHWTRATPTEVEQTPEETQLLDRLERIAAAPPPVDAAPTDPLVGTCLRHYEILAPLGHGGMGAVYRARDSNLDRIVAIKVLPAAHRHDVESTRRFQREFRALGRLDHPHVVRALNADEHAGIRYLVMELISGTDLQKRVRTSGPLPITQACKIVRQAAEGLAYIHANGVVHRDIKPSNIVVAEGDRVVVVDLGLALIRQEPMEASSVPSETIDATHDAPMTSADAIMGTIDYMAPEQACDSHSVDQRADLYGLGCVLYFLLTGRPPFGRSSEGAIQSLMLRLQQPAPKLREALPPAPPALDALVARLLERNPADRFASATELAEALTPFLATNEGTVSEGIASEPTGGSPKAVVLRRRSRLVGGKWIAAGLLAAALSAAATLFVIATRDGEVIISIPEGAEGELQVQLVGEDQIRIMDEKAGWTTQVKPGSYEVRLNGASADQFSIKKDRFVVTRRGEVRVEIQRRAVDRTLAPRADLPLFEVDFHAPRPGWPEEYKPDLEMGVRNGCYRVRVEPGDNYMATAQWPQDVFPLDAEVVGRATGSPQGGWGLQFWGPKQPQFILQVKLLEHGRRVDCILLEVDPEKQRLTQQYRRRLGSWPVAGGTPSNDGFQRLRVILLEDKLVVFVDDRFIGQYEGKLGVFHTYLCAYQGDSRVTMEVDHVRFWRAIVVDRSAGPPP